MGRHNSHNDLKAAEALALRNRIMDLRMAGYSVTKIAEALNIAKSTASVHVKRALKELADSTLDTTANYRTLNMQRLERLLAGVWPAASSGKDWKATREARSILDQQAKLLGMNAPVKIAHTDPTGDQERAALGVVPVPAGVDLHAWLAKYSHQVEDTREPSDDD